MYKGIRVSPITFLNMVWSSPKIIPKIITSGSPFPGLKIDWVLGRLIMERQKARNQASEPQQERNHIENSSSGFLNVEAIAKYLGIKPSTLYSMVEEKQIPHYRIGRQIRFRKSEIDHWMVGQREPVVDVKLEARRVIRSVEKKSDLNVERIVAKAIDEAKEKRYTPDYGKPDRKGLGKEVSDGTV
jgi:excisionase family DNA binding protein